ncbi:MAG: hypothetical protein KBC00_01920 [Candidatus Levybacteria bacterium]|nr:hypothetical protein [Candidatus Levybacteria bacterium]MBP9815081.1 hypothetical protein [Candidatus Levybacteria bacterium]
MIKERKRKSNGTNSVAAAGIGAVIGASVAIAASEALKNPKTKEKVIHTLEIVKNQAIDKIPQAVYEGKKNAELKKLGKNITKKVNKRADRIKGAVKNNTKVPTAIN